MRASFFSVISGQVRYDKETPFGHKCLFAEITAILNMYGQCFASNEHFARILDVSERTIKRWLKDLSDRGHISLKYVYRPNTKEIQKRYITINWMQDDELVRFLEKMWGQVCPLGGDKTKNVLGWGQTGSKGGVTDGLDNHIKEEEERLKEEKDGKPSVQTEKTENDNPPLGKQPSLEKELIEWFKENITNPRQWDLEKERKWAAAFKALFPTEKKGGWTADEIKDACLKAKADKYWGTKLLSPEMLKTKSRTYNETHIELFTRLKNDTNTIHTRSGQRIHGLDTRHIDGFADD